MNRFDVSGKCIWDDDDAYLALGHGRDEMINAGLQALEKNRKYLTDNIGYGLMARDIVMEIFIAMRDVEMSQPGDD